MKSAGDVLDFQALNLEIGMDANNFQYILAETNDFKNVFLIISGYNKI